MVPDHEALGFDADRLHAVREGVEMFLNPFDQRALRVALDLKRPGDRVSVASMGPPGVTGALSEAFALGADRVGLVCDPALAGSDTLVTARVLTRLLGRWGSELVLLGARTTDGETGQVPAEIAALRHVPLAGSARRVERDDASGGLRVTTDTESGWATWRVPIPSVISVGEKVAKIVHPSEEERAIAASRTVERVTLSDLEILPNLVGFEGSPTRVIAVRSEETHRRGLVLREGPLPDRLDRARVMLRGWGAFRRRPERALGPSPPPRSPPGAASLVLVTGPDGRLEDRTLPMLSESVRTLGAAPSAVWVGSAPVPHERDRLRTAGAAELFLTEVPPERLDGRAAALTVERILIGRPHFETGFFLSSHFGREVAGRVAARLGLGLTGDALGVERTPEGSLVWSKPAFGGNAVARIVSVTRPSLATVRPGVFGLGEPGRSDRWTVTPVEPPGEPRELTPIAAGPEPVEGFGDLDQARVAVSLGVGVGGPDGVEQVRRLLAGTGWAIAATRRVVDAGWVPRSLQVGLTGRSAAPDLALLIGVRGSPNHLVGWKRAGTLLAINPDPGAPIFPGSDLGLVAPWEEALPALIEGIRRELEGGAATVSGAPV